MPRVMHVVDWAFQLQWRQNTHKKIHNGRNDQRIIYFPSPQNWHNNTRNEMIYASFLSWLSNTKLTWQYKKQSTYHLFPTSTQLTWQYKKWSTFEVGHYLNLLLELHFWIPLKWAGWSVSCLFWSIPMCLACTSAKTRPLKDIHVPLVEWLSYYIITCGLLEHHTIVVVYFNLFFLLFLGFWGLLFIWVWYLSDLLSFLHCNLFSLWEIGLHPPKKKVPFCCCHKSCSSIKQKKSKFTNLKGSTKVQQE